MLHRYGIYCTCNMYIYLLIETCIIILLLICKYDLQDSVIHFLRGYLLSFFYVLSLIYNKNSLTHFVHIV